MQDIRYDRQLRLWGDHGQNSLQSTSVCVLGSSALATEIVKNLVLAGVQRVCIIDDAIVTQPDLGQNFFLTSDDLGKPRSECVIINLKELNPSVLCEARSYSQEQLHEEKPLRFLCSFAVVLAANSGIHHYLSDLADTLFAKGIPFVYARVCGLLGTIRISVKEHFIIDNHEENPKPDLRLDRPFSTLENMLSDSKNIIEMTSEELKHTPYLLLYFKALEMYRNAANTSTAFPATYKDRQHFIDCLCSLRQPDEKGNLDSENFDEAKAAVSRSIQPTTIPNEVMEILKDEKCVNESETENFWLLCYGLRQFVEKHGVLPLSGALPDMTSDSQRYTRLAKIFHEKAQQDAHEVLLYVREAEKRRGVNKLITENECFQFCKKSAHIRLQRGTPLRGNFAYKPLIDDIEQLEDDANPTPAIWLLLLSACHRFPGESANISTNQDLEGLKKHVIWLIEASEGNPDEIMRKIPSGAFKEILRFANSEPHVVSSLIGGITAQEIIKLATRQYVPIDTTFIYDGASQNSATYRL